MKLTDRQNVRQFCVWTCIRWLQHGSSMVMLDLLEIRVGIGAVSGCGGGAVLRECFWQLSLRCFTVCLGSILG